MILWLSRHNTAHSRSLIKVLAPEAIAHNHKNTKLMCYLIISFPFSASQDLIQHNPRSSHKKHDSRRVEGCCTPGASPGSHSATFLAAAMAQQLRDHRGASGAHSTRAKLAEIQSGRNQQQRMDNAKLCRPGVTPPVLAKNPLLRLN